MRVIPGATDVTTYFKLRLAADGTEATGLTITDFDLQYVRSGAAPAAKVDATALAATDSAHADNKAIEVDATDQPGLYRVDWPDAAFAANVREVILTVKCATCFVEDLRVELDRPEVLLAATQPNNISFSGTIGTAGTVTFNAFTVTNALTAATIASTSTTTLNALTISNALTVSGTTSLAAVTTSGTVTFNAFTVTNAMTVGGNLVVTGAFLSINASNDVRGIQVDTFTSTGQGQITTLMNAVVVDYRLDELLDADSDIDGAQPPTVGSVFHELMSKTAGSFTFDQTTDSNEAIKDALLTAAQAQTEAEEALQTYHLDHFIASADPGGAVANSSFLAKLVSKSATPAFSSFNNTTDSLEAIADGGGGGGATAQQVWEYATRTLTAFAFDATVSVVSPTSVRGDIEVIQGDDYDDAETRQIPLSSSSWPELTDAAVYLDIYVPGNPRIYKTLTGTVVTPTGTKAIKFQLTDTETLALNAGHYLYNCWALLSNSNVVTLVRGKFKVVRRSDI